MRQGSVALKFLKHSVLPLLSLLTPNYKPWSRWIVIETSSSSTLEYEFRGRWTFPAIPRERLRWCIWRRHAAFHAAPVGLQHRSFVHSGSTLDLHNAYMLKTGVANISTLSVVDQTRFSNAIWTVTVRRAYSMTIHKIYWQHFAIAKCCQ